MILVGPCTSNALPHHSSDTSLCLGQEGRLFITYTITATPPHLHKTKKKKKKYCDITKEPVVYPTGGCPGG